MCGISGMVAVGRSETPLPLDELARIDAALARRGPDGNAAWRSASGRVALAHRRLAILDPSPAGAQPMRSADGRFTLVFNGEIYNFRELGRELANRGVALRSDSDSEVLLELVSRDGTPALSRLRGMYAFALWDEREEELLLARDPYGIKPLYYAELNGVLRFASQVKALEAGGGLPLDLDPAAVAGFLCWGAVPEPLTLRSAIRALPAGHLLRVSAAHGVRIEAVPYAPPDPLPPTTEGALAESVAAHLVSDVPVALFLSAGLDSALVAALACRAGGERPTALTLTWPEVRGTDLDEEPLARATAEALGMRHVVREVRAEQVRESLPEILAAMDQPSIDGFNTWLIARVAKEEGFKVALSGLGGDELFGGYPSFRDVGAWQRRARRWARVPGARALAPRLLGLGAAPPKARGALRHGTSLAGAYFLRRGLYLPAEVESLAARSESTPLAPLGGRFDPILDAWEGLADGLLGPLSSRLNDPWASVHCMESSIYLRRQLLRDADWAGMAHGVELRVPLVDARLRLALEARRFEPARSAGKAAAIRSVAPKLPARLFSRPKSGFQLPVAEWLETHKGGPVSVGHSSRRLAQWLLRSFGIELERSPRAA